MGACVGSGCRGVGVVDGVWGFLSAIRCGCCWLERDGSMGSRRWVVVAVFGGTGDFAAGGRFGGNVMLTWGA